MAPTPRSRSRLVVLKVARSSLRKFPSDSTPSAAPSSPSSSAVDSAALATDSVNTPDPSGASANGLLAPPNGLHRKGIPGPKPGLKRQASHTTLNGDTPKPRGKPGPKKKKIEGPNGTLIPVSAPKMNPKASAGAINANLRALDRSGKPCRRWNRKPFTVKSFTGTIWDAGTWTAPLRPAAAVDENGNPVTNGKSVGEGQVNSSAPASDVAAGTLKHEHVNSSALPSEKSNSGGDGDTPLPPVSVLAPSSPAPIAVS